MENAEYDVGETFPVQFTWRLPDGDFIRAVFEAEVRDHVPEAEKYVVTLNRLVAGRQEDSDGQMRSQEAFSRDYWRMVGDLIGNKVTLAYEAADGRALHMRLATLTGEHNFFTRYIDVQKMADKIRHLRGEAPPD